MYWESDNVVIWPYYALHVGHRLKILWGKSQATVPAPGKKGGRELAPVPGLPEGRYDCVGTCFSYRIFSLEGEMSMCAMGTCAHYMEL